MRYERTNLPVAGVDHWLNRQVTSHRSLLGAGIDYQRAI